MKGISLPANNAIDVCNASEYMGVSLPVNAAIDVMDSTLVCVRPLSTGDIIARECRD